MKGWRKEKLDEHFDSKLASKVGRGPQPTMQTLQTWFYQAKNVMKELDINTQLIPVTTPFEFLDLWYAPLHSKWNSHDRRLVAHLEDLAHTS